MEAELQLRLNEAIQGNDDAFCRLVEHYQAGVYNLCYRMLSNRHEAEDAAQEVFWKAYKALHRYDHERSFQTWLLSIASHYCIDQYRKRKLTLVSIDQPFEETFQSNVPTPEKVIAQSENATSIETLVSTLKPTDRAAVILRYWYEMSEKEIAESLQLSVSAVKSRLFRARKQLAHNLEIVGNDSKRYERECYEPSNV
ncbi:MAG: sigma-70 family RNA polymerase sigma factor [Anaerolineaceae bacterium]|nr:sigma-70 family RNA polymerase sigma factor [Anaerolineaceae bacterium]